MVKKGRLLGFYLLWNILFSVNKWICLKVWGMYSHQTGWPVRACSLLCWSSFLLVWSLMWVENTGKKLKSSNEPFIYRPYMAGYLRGSSKPLIDNSCCNQRSDSNSKGRGALCRIPPLHQHFRGLKWRARNPSKPDFPLEFRLCSWGPICSCPQQNPICSSSVTTKSITFPISVLAFPNHFHNCARP